MGESRAELILENILGASHELGEPQSRIEVLLMELLEELSGGGPSTCKVIELLDPEDATKSKYTPDEIKEFIDNGCMFTFSSHLVLHINYSGAANTSFGYVDSTSGLNYKVIYKKINAYKELTDDTSFGASELNFPYSVNGIDFTESGAISISAIQSDSNGYYFEV